MLPKIYLDPAKKIIILNLIKKKKNLLNRIEEYLIKFVNNVNISISIIEQ